MNRQIKFRAWNKKEKKMIDLYSINLPNTSGTEEPYRQMIFMQFTGLLDKNGKEIYEGDVVRWYGRIGEEFYESGIGEVFYEKGRYLVKDFYVCRQDDPSDAFGENAELEVIGNIYENPELIK